ncbi:hypothetical protein CR513_51630, partial [Mucuna pruriens]
MFGHIQTILNGLQSLWHGNLSAQPSKKLSTYTHVKKKNKTRHKGKALKVQSNSNSLDKSSSRSIDDEVSPMPQKFKKMVQKNGNCKSYPKKDKYKKYSKDKDSKIECFEFKKPKHIKEEKAL